MACKLKWLLWWAIGQVPLEGCPEPVNIGVLWAPLFRNPRALIMIEMYDLGINARRPIIFLIAR